MLNARRHQRILRRLRRQGRLRCIGGAQRLTTSEVFAVGAVPAVAFLVVGVLNAQWRQR